MNYSSQKRDSERKRMNTLKQAYRPLFYKGYRIDHVEKGVYTVIGYSRSLKDVGVCGTFTSVIESKQAIDKYGRDDGGLF